MGYRRNDTRVTFDDVRNASFDTAGKWFDYTRERFWMDSIEHYRIDMLQAYLDDNYTGEQLFPLFQAVNSYNGGFEWVDIQPFSEWAYCADADLICTFIDDLGGEKITPDTLCRWNDSAYATFETTTYEQVYDDCEFCTPDLAFVLVNDNDIRRNEELVYAGFGELAALLDQWAIEGQVEFAACGGRA